MILVCDTNVLVSGLAFPGGIPDKLVRAILSGRFVHATSPDILTELRRILETKLAFAKDRTERALYLISDASVLVYPIERLSVITADEPDNRILECAVAAKASHLITGDKHHLLPLKVFQDITILSPSDFAGAVGLV